MSILRGATRRGQRSSDILLGPNNWVGQAGRYGKLVALALASVFFLASCGSAGFERDAANEVSETSMVAQPADADETADAVSIPTAVPTTSEVEVVALAADAAELEAEVFYVDDECDTRFFPGFPPDQAWCFEDWALATVDGFGVDLASYRLVEGSSREIATGPIIGQIDLGETLNLGMPLRVAEELCRRSAETRESDPANCDPHTSAAASSLAFVQSHLWRVDGGPPAADSATSGVAAVRTGLEFSPFLNRLASWEVAGASDGCWIRTGTVTAQCAVDIRDFTGSIVDTIVVSSYPEGVIDETFDGFTGRYEITGITTSLAAADIRLNRWVLSSSSFGRVEVGMTLREAQRALGFGLDLAGSRDGEVGVSCYFATPTGFVGLFYIVQGATSAEPLDGVIQSIVVSAPDYPAASGIRVGSPSDALVVTLGDRLIPRDHGTSPEGRYFDMPESADSDRLVRFESYEGDTISQMRAGVSASVTAADGCR